MSTITRWVAIAVATFVVAGCSTMGHERKEHEQEMYRHMPPGEEGVARARVDGGARQRETIAYAGGQVQEGEIAIFVTTEAIPEPNEGRPDPGLAGMIEPDRIAPAHTKRFHETATAAGNNVDTGTAEESLQILQHFDLTPGYGVSGRITERLPGPLLIERDGEGNVVSVLARVALLVETRDAERSVAHTAYLMTGNKAVHAGLKITRLRE